MTFFESTKRRAVRSVNESTRLWMTLLAGALAVVCVALSGCSGCGSPLVGGECRDGLSLCGGRCVDTRTDSRNCGFCSNVCQTGLTCIAGSCRPPFDGSDLDANNCGSTDCDKDGSPRQDGSSGDGGTGSGDGGAGDGGMGDSGLPGCGLGTKDCPPWGCVNIDTDPNHCGMCGRMCDVDAGQYCAGTCVAGCPAEKPDTCNGACIDTLTDPDHCGPRGSGCGRECRTGICAGGECQGSIAGDVVVIGHDYSATVNTPMQQVIGNAIFMRRKKMVSVIAYNGNSAVASVNGTNNAITTFGNGAGLEWGNLTTPGNGDPVVGLPDDQYPAMLGKFDVFLIYAQYGATDARLHQLWDLWANSMDSFLRKGGVIVLLDGLSPNNAGTFQILQDNAAPERSLFRADRRFDLSNRNLNVVDSNDTVGNGLFSMYFGLAPTVGFETPLARVIVRDAVDSQPVVIHIAAPSP